MNKFETKFIQKSFPVLGSPLERSYGCGVVDFQVAQHALLSSIQSRTNAKYNVCHSNVNDSRFEL